MKFFFPDTQDFVDPSFNFTTEERSSTRVRQRDDLYPHEVFAQPPYDGMLVSKAAVDALPGGATRYTLAQRNRVLRLGLRNYLRLDATGRKRLELMGDCGSFSYVREEYPPFTVDEIINFYEECGFDYGISVDHVILGFQAEADLLKKCHDEEPVGTEWRQRQEITLTLADEFLRESRRRKTGFFPMGVAQGWSPKSYAHSVAQLQKMGYEYIALGGMVPLKTREILACLEVIEQVRAPKTRFHLLGVTRCEQLPLFQGFGVTSFDSTSPLRKAFKDDKDNYYAEEGAYSAVRVPQIDANTKLLNRIKSGEVDQTVAHRMERNCLKLLMAYDRKEAALESVLEALREYEALFDARSNRTEVYRDVLERRPWKECECEVCRDLGIHVLLFRGAERNRRRGFHNLHVFYRQLVRQLDGLKSARQADAAAGAGTP